jgi:hypothetical protein
VPKDLEVIGKTIDDAPRKTSIAAKNWDLADFTAVKRVDEMASFKREGSYAEAMRNRVDLSDDEQSLCYKKSSPRPRSSSSTKKSSMPSPRASTASIPSASPTPT